MISKYSACIYDPVRNPRNDDEDYGNWRTATNLILTNGASSG